MRAAFITRWFGLGITLVGTIFHPDPVLLAAGATVVTGSMAYDGAMGRASVWSPRKLADMEAELLDDPRSYAEQALDPPPEEGMGTSGELR